MGAPSGLVVVAGEGGAPEEEKRTLRWLVPGLVIGRTNDSRSLKGLCGKVRSRILTVLGNLWGSEVSRQVGRYRQV